MVEALALLLLAKSSIFFLATAVDYARARSISVVLLYAGNLVLGTVGGVVTRLHARWYETGSP